MSSASLFVLVEDVIVKASDADFVVSATDVAVIVGALFGDAGTFAGGA